MTKPPFETDAATRAVITVNRGRGFVIEGLIPNPVKEGMVLGRKFRPSRFLRRHYIVTAAHCLPHLPPAHPWAGVEEKTYKVIGALGRKPTVLAECVFVDPVADVAVLGRPDGQAFENADEAWDEFMEGAGTLHLELKPLGRRPTTGWLLSLDGRWSPCRVSTVGLRETGLWVTKALAGIKGGMSGSPIISDNGRVIGALSTSGGNSLDVVHTEGGPQPQLTQCLPRWLVQQLTVARARSIVSREREKARGNSRGNSEGNGGKRR